MASTALIHMIRTAGDPYMLAWVFGWLLVNCFILVFIWCFLVTTTCALARGGRGLVDHPCTCKSSLVLLILVVPIFFLKSDNLVFAIGFDCLYSQFQSASCPPSRWSLPEPCLCCVVSMIWQVRVFQSTADVTCFLKSDNLILLLVCDFVLCQGGFTNSTKRWFPLCCHRYKCLTIFTIVPPLHSQ